MNFASGIQPTSNGETLTGHAEGNPVPSCSEELQTGVETCVQPYQMVLGAMRGLEMGAEPILANGRRGARGETNAPIAA